jgi:hypothetical protein
MELSTRLLAFGWDFPMLFLMLDFFSRVYFAGLVFATVWSISILFRFAARARNSGASPNLDLFALSKLDHKLKSLFSMSLILAGACAANQILGVSRIYMVDRFTDANPVYALDEAWAVSQIIAGILLLLRAIRWYTSAVVASTRQELGDPTIS